jgi:hypothetical protein
MYPTIKMNDGGDAAESIRNLGIRRNPKDLNDMKLKEEYQVKISKRSAVLEIFDDNVDINWTRKKYYREYTSFSKRQSTLL